MANITIRNLDDDAKTRLRVREAGNGHSMESVIDIGGIRRPSELTRKSPAPAVATWVSDPHLDDLFFSAVSEAELCYGAAILPAGRRRDTLLSEIETMLRDAFEDRVLPCDSEATPARW